MASTNLHRQHLNSRNFYYQVQKKSEKITENELKKKNKVSDQQTCENGCEKWSGLCSRA